MKFFQNLTFYSLFLFFMSLNSIYAKSSLISPIPLPHQEIINLQTQPCDNKCLQQLSKEGQIFSYLALFSKEAKENKGLLDTFEQYAKLAQIDITPALEEIPTTSFNVALLFARKIIGNYSSNATNTILSYLLTQEKNFNFETFDSIGESATQLQATLEKIQQKGYHYIIAILTNSGAKILTTLDYNIPTYIASINKTQILEENDFLQGSTIPSHIIFGGINYEEQIQYLSQIDPNTTAAALNDDSLIGKKLANWVKKYNNTNKNAVVYEEIFNEQKIKDFPKTIRSLARTLRNSRIFLNTPPTDSAMILSQITYNRINTRNGIYSSQLNYTPILFSLTQSNDRKNLIITNSIEPLADNLVEHASLLNSDLDYDWINYSSALGAEYFYLQTFLDGKKYYPQTIQDNSVIYKTQLYRADSDHFILIQ